MLNLTPFLKLYQKRRLKQLAKMDPVATQEQQLLNLVRKGSQTAFGKDHSFSTIKSVEDFQRQVPLRSYEQLWNEYLKDKFPIVDNIIWPGCIPCYAVSSGTTSGTTKYIPYTKEMQQSNTKAGLDLLVYHLNNKADSRIFAGKSFILGGSTDLLEQAPGIYSGDLSGISVKTLPLWARLRYFPPKDLALIKDWEEKIETLAKACRSETISMISGVPSWLLIFFNELFERYNIESQRLVDVFPDLEMLVHGGVNFSPYRKQFEELLQGSKAELREVYPASEGFIAIADATPEQGMRLNLDHQLFFEFVPLEELGSENPRRHWVKTIEPGINYAVVLTSCAGFYSYLIGDTVSFLEVSPPRLIVTGRTSYYLSAFGEHVIEDELQDAIATAASHVNTTVVDFSVGPVFPSSQQELGRHEYVIEFEQGPLPDETLQQFKETLDKRLCERNEDYEGHRAEGFGLDLPGIRQATPGMFAAWMKSRGKLGGQHKVPRVINDLELLDNLLSFHEQYQDSSLSD